MTDYEIEDIAGTAIPARGLKILSIGPMKRLAWQWQVNGNIRTHSIIIEDGNELDATALSALVHSAIGDIRDKYPDEDFPL